MQIAEGTSYRSLTIEGLTFQVPEPYAEGHTLNAGEASQLNQVLGENLRNNFASAVKDAKAKAAEANGLMKTDSEGKEVPDIAQVTSDLLDMDELQGAFNEYVTEYEFGVRRGGGGRLPTDPVEREALSIATDKVRAAIKAKNITLNSVPAEKIRELAEKLIANNPAITEEAKRRVAAAADIALDEINV